MAEEKEKEDVNRYNQSIVFTGPNSGRYTWVINNKSLIIKILNAENGKQFESKSFVMRNMNWSILLYPNGDITEHTGSVMIYLKLLSIPQIIDTVVLCSSISCDKTFSAYGKIRSYTQTNNIWGFPDRARTLLLSEWKSINSDTLSITVTINVIKIILNTMITTNIEDHLCLLPHFWTNRKQSFPKKWKFEYKFDTITMNIFKKSHVGKGFVSNIIDNTWQLAIYPNGISQDCKQYVGLYLSLCNKPPEAAEIAIRRSITCSETGTFWSQQMTYMVDNSSRGTAQFMKVSDLLALDHLTLLVDIEIGSIKKDERTECIISDTATIDRVLKLSFDDDNDDNDDDEENKFDPIINLQDKTVSISTLNSKMQSMQNLIDKQTLQIQQLTNKNNEKEKTIKEMSVSITTLQNVIYMNGKIVKILTNKVNKMEAHVFEEKKNNQVNHNNINNLTASVLDLKQLITTTTTTTTSLHARYTHNKQNNNQTPGMQLKSWCANAITLPEYADIFAESGFEDADLEWEWKSLCIK